MRVINLLPLAVLSTAIVIPDEAITERLLGVSKRVVRMTVEPLPGNHIFDRVEETFRSGLDFSSNALDNALAVGKKAAGAFKCHSSMTAFDTTAWLETATDSLKELDVRRRLAVPYDKKPHDHPKANQTVYELINSSKYTTKFAKLINEYDDLVQILNGTAANYTVFAPTDKAFEHLPKHHKPSKELIKKVLSYHYSPEFYPAGRILVSQTIPTAYHEEALGGEPQRLRTSLGLRGLTVNYFSHVVAVNIFGSNGVIHGIDSLLLPPPPALKIISLLPGDFSTLQLALTKTGLAREISKSEHVGGTLFAPSNHAWQKLGPKVNAFLFSPYGRRFLKALLEYHIVANQTLYSDAFYRPKELDAVNGQNIPRGVFHVDLKTLLDGKSLSIDVARFGRLINIRINGYTDVAVQDGLAKDGVIHILSSVLIPPKKPTGEAQKCEELTVEDLKERLSDYVDEEDEAKENGWFEL